MRADRVISAVDTHTEGMPTRVVTGGIGVLPGDTMLERRQNFERDYDHLRTLLMYEPRGHSAMSGAILQPPIHPDADAGVLFIEVTGCLAMCGHGTMGLATVMVETGMVDVTEPVTTIRLDTPAGLVTADVEVEDGAARAVTITNVPSFVYETDVRVPVAGDVGDVTLDVAFGGNFYAIVPSERIGIEVVPDNASELIRCGLQIMAATERRVQPKHPVDEQIRGLRHVVITAPGTDGASARAATVIHPGWVDRSPCGTGTSARLAQLYSQGRLALGEPFVHASLIDSRFTGTLVEETKVASFPAVVPEIRGRAWITSTGQYLLDPSDPYPAGFLLSRGVQQVSGDRSDVPA